MAIQELTTLEIKEVTGAFGVGDAMQVGANIFSTAINAMAPIWTPLSAMPGMGVVHNVVDMAFLAGAEGAYGLGSMLGGSQNQVKFHYAKEKEAGVYNVGGILSGFNPLKKI
jgi:hypothetical protein